MNFPTCINTNPEAIEDKLIYDDSYQGRRILIKQINHPYSLTVTTGYDQTSKKLTTKQEHLDGWKCAYVEIKDSDNLSKIDYEIKTKIALGNEVLEDTFVGFSTTEPYSCKWDTKDCVKECKLMIDQLNK